MNQFILGAHSLSSMFTINQYPALKRAMYQTVDAGGTLFEIPYLLCQLKRKDRWKTVATAARRTGIKEIALCHFWPRDSHGAPVGDPLGNKAEVNMALQTMSEIIDAADTIRESGVIVQFIDGPTWGCLGWKYRLKVAERHKRAADFLYSVGEKCHHASLTLAVEFLRPVEDRVIGGTEAMIKVLKQVMHPSVRMHFDVFHSIECGENPAVSIRKAKNWISYLHLHGDLRIAPGAPGDNRDWKEIVAAIKKIDSLTNIPVVPEPFGEKTCRENPTLGEGLPIPLPFPQYLTVAYATLREAGLPV